MKYKKHVIIIRPSSEKQKSDADSGEFAYQYMPLGALYLAESLIAHGYTVAIVDTNNIATLLKIDELVCEDTICICISTLSGLQLKNAIFIAKALKLKYPQIPLIWGGVHVTQTPEQTLQNNFVDYIVYGEGENTLVTLLDALNNKEPLYDKTGIGFKNKEGFFIGKKTEYFNISEKIFHLPYHLLDMNKYARKLIIGAERCYPVLTSRGCAFKCNFCSNSSDVIRFNSLDHVVNDIKILVDKYGLDMLEYADVNFLLKEQHLLDIISAIRKEGIIIKYKISAIIDLLLRVKKETWKIFKEYGLVTVGLAPESGSQRILDYMNKKITLQQFYQINDFLSSQNIMTTINILICTPQETREDLKLTLKLIINFTKTALYTPYPFAMFKYDPLPGTTMLEDAIKYGLERPDSLEKWALFYDQNPSDTKDLMRPWILIEDYPFIERAVYLVEKLKSELKGRDKTDIKAVKDAVMQIEKLIAEN